MLEKKYYLHPTINLLLLSSILTASLNSHCSILGNHHRPESANIPLLPANKDTDSRHTIQAKETESDHMTASSTDRVDSSPPAFLSMEGVKILSVTLIAVASGGAFVYVITKRVSAVAH